MVCCVPMAEQLSQLVVSPIVLGWRKRERVVKKGLKIENLSRINQDLAKFCAPESAAFLNPCQKLKTCFGIFWTPKRMSNREPSQFVSSLNHRPVF